MLRQALPVTSDEKGPLSTTRWRNFGAYAFALLWPVAKLPPLLGLPRTAKTREFQDWFDEHVVGQGQFYDDVVGVEFP